MNSNEEDAEEDMEEDAYIEEDITMIEDDVEFKDVELTEEDVEVEEPVLDLDENEDPEPESRKVIVNCICFYIYCCIFLIMCLQFCQYPSLL